MVRISYAIEELDTEHPIYKAIADKNLSKVKEFFSVENMSADDLGLKNDDGTYSGKDRKLWRPDVHAHRFPSMRMPSPAFFAAALGATDILKYLLEKGASFGHKFTYQYKTDLLRTAFEFLQVETLEWILESQKNSDLIRDAYFIANSSPDKFSRRTNIMDRNQRLPKEEFTKILAQMQEMLKSKFFKNYQAVPFEVAIDSFSIDEKTGKPKDEEKGRYIFDTLPKKYILKTAYSLLETDKSYKEYLGINILEKVCSLPREMRKTFKSGEFTSEEIERAHFTISSYYFGESGENFYNGMGNTDKALFHALSLPVKHPWKTEIVRRYFFGDELREEQELPQVVVDVLNNTDDLIGKLTSIRLFKETFRANALEIGLEETQKELKDTKKELESVKSDVKNLAQENQSMKNDLTFLKAQLKKLLAASSIKTEKNEMVKGGPKPGRTI